MKPKMRKPMPAMQTASTSDEATLPGNAGSPTAPMNNANPGAMLKKKTGLAGAFNKSKLMA